MSTVRDECPTRGLLSWAYEKPICKMGIQERNYFPEACRELIEDGKT